MTFGVQRLRDRENDLLVGARGGRDVLQFFGQRLARDRDAVAVQQSGVEQDLHDLRNAAGLMQVGRHVLARRLQIADHTGTRLRMRSKSSMVHSTSAACAIAR